MSYVEPTNPTSIQKYRSIRRDRHPRITTYMGIYTYICRSREEDVLREKRRGRDRERKKRENTEGESQRHRERPGQMCTYRERVRASSQCSIWSFFRSSSRRTPQPKLSNSTRKHRHRTPTHHIHSLRGIYACAHINCLSVTSLCVYVHTQKSTASAQGGRPPAKIPPQSILPTAPYAPTHLHIHGRIYIREHTTLLDWTDDSC